MSTYVPGYQHDIFVSYAPVDDEPLMGVGVGWVTTLIRELKVLLDQKLGDKNAFSYYQYDTFVGYVPLADEPSDVTDFRSELDCDTKSKLSFLKPLFLLPLFLLLKRLEPTSAISEEDKQLSTDFISEPDCDTKSKLSLLSFLKLLFFLPLFLLLKVLEPTSAISEEDKQLSAASERAKQLSAASERAKQLNSAATLLLILSPAYLTSPQCIAELRTFLKRVGQNSGRVFVVEYDEIEAKPEELSDVLGYRFWEADVAGRSQTLGIPKPVPDKDFKYYHKLTYLRDDLSKELKYLREQIEESERRKIEDLRKQIEESKKKRTALVEKILRQVWKWITWPWKWLWKWKIIVVIVLCIVLLIVLPIVIWQSYRFESQLAQAIQLVKSEDYLNANKILEETYGLTYKLNIIVSPSRRHARNLLVWFTKLMEETKEQMNEGKDLPGKPRSVAIAPNGKSVAVGFEDGTRRLYSLPEMELLWGWKAHNDTIHRLTFNREGTLLASASQDKTAKLWQVEDGELQQILEGHTGGIHGLAFSYVGDWLGLITASDDGSIGVFTVGTEQKNFHAVHGNAIHDGQCLLFRDEKGNVQLQNPKNGQYTLLQDFLAKSQQRLWASFSTDCQQVATVGKNSMVTIYTVRDGQVPSLQQLMGHSDTVWRVIFSPDNQQVATVSSDATVRLWDLKNGNKLFTLRLPTNSDWPTSLYDFDFRCTSNGDCWIAVPLTRGKLALYELKQIYVD